MVVLFDGFSETHLKPVQIEIFIDRILSTSLSFNAMDYRSVIDN